MAVITEAELLDALRADDGDSATVARLRDMAIAVVDREAPDAPEAIRNEAIVRLAGYAFDAPLFASNPTNAFRNSGAEMLLRPYVIRRGLVV